MSNIICRGMHSAERGASCLGFPAATWLLASAYPDDKLLKSMNLLAQPNSFRREGLHAYNNAGVQGRGLGHDLAGGACWTRVALLARLLLTGALSLLVCNLGFSDTVFLVGGEKLIGKIKAEQPDRLVFESKTLGEIVVRRANIEKIELDPAPAPLAPGPGSTNQLAVSPAWGLLTNQSMPWVTGTPGGDSYDWIQLKSGEWLKGRLKSLQQDTVDFDSEEMNRLDFERKDVRILRLPRFNAVRFETRRTDTGSVVVTTNEVLVIGATTNTYPRSELIGITATGKRELDNWSAGISAGLTFRAGNTHQADYNAQVEIHRRTPSTDLSLEYLGNFSENMGDQLANNHRVTAKFDYFLSRRLFIEVPYLEYYRDPLQNIDARFTAGVGVGYDLIKNRRVEWNVTAGPAYQENWYTSVQSGDSKQPGAAALVIGSKIDIELTKRLDFITEFRAQFTSKEVGETSYHGLAKLKFEVHKRLNANISLTWDRITNPQTDASGVTPQRDDFRLVTGLGVDL